MTQTGLAASAVTLCALLAATSANAGIAHSFLGGPFHRFGNAAAIREPVLPILHAVDLPGPVDFLRALAAAPPTAVPYPFLNPPPPENISRPLCNAETFALSLRAEVRLMLGCPLIPIFGYNGASPERRQD